MYITIYIISGTILVDQPSGQNPCQGYSLHTAGKPQIRFWMTEILYITIHHNIHTRDYISIYYNISFSHHTAGKAQLRWKNWMAFGLLMMMNNVFGQNCELSCISGNATKNVARIKSIQVINVIWRLNPTQLSIFVSYLYAVKLFFIEEVLGGIYKL